MPEPLEQPEPDEELLDEATESPDENEDQPTDDDVFDDTEGDDADTPDDSEDAEDGEDPFDVDEDSDLPASLRQLRAALREQGYTFGEDGSPVPPAAPATVLPVADTAPVPSLSGEPAPFLNPSEFRGYTVQTDGTDLFDLRYEDPASQEALGLINGTEDEDGNIISEGIGELQYIVQMNLYNGAKTKYAEDYDGRVESATRTQMPAFQESVQTARTEAKAMLLDLGDTQADAILSTLYPRANEVISEYISDRVTELTARGTTARRAGLIANKEVLDNPKAYETAMGMAILKDVKGFVESVKQAARGEAITPPKAGAPPRPPVPSVSRTQGGSAPPTKLSTVNATAGEREMARGRGLTDPKEINNYVRELRKYTGVS